MKNHFLINCHCCTLQLLYHFDNQVGFLFNFPWPLQLSLYNLWFVSPALVNSIYIIIQLVHSWTPNKPKNYIFVIRKNKIVNTNLHRCHRSGYQITSQVRSDRIDSISAAKRWMMHIYMLESIGTRDRQAWLTLKAKGAFNYFRASIVVRTILFE